MISALVEDSTLVAGYDCPLVIRLTNIDRRVCRSILFRVHLPPDLVVMSGSERVNLAELAPGASHRIQLIVRPSRTGEFLLHSERFEYRDASDRPKPVRRWQATVTAEKPVLSPRQQAAARAEEFAQAQRWNAAWPMYLAAGLEQLAQFCLGKAVAELQQDGRYGEVARQFANYGRQLRDGMCQEL